MEQLRIRDHIIHVTQNELRLRDLKNGELTIQPAEVNDVRELVGIVWKMTSLPAMPELTPSPSGVFEARIDSKNAEIRRVNEPQGNSSFSFAINECDFVIQLIDLGLDKLKDLFSLAPQPRSTGNLSPPTNFDFFEGRS